MFRCLGLLCISGWLPAQGHVPSMKSLPASSKSRLPKEGGLAFLDGDLMVVCSAIREAGGVVVCHALPILLATSDPELCVSSGARKASLVSPTGGPSLAKQIARRSLSSAASIGDLSAETQQLGAGD